MRRRADFTRLFHYADFRRGFDQPLLVEQKRQIGKVGRRGRTRTDQSANLIHPPHHALVEHIVMAHGVVNALGTFNQTREDFVQVIDRKGIIDAEVGSGALRSEPVAVP